MTTDIVTADIITADIITLNGDQFSDSVSVEHLAVSGTEDWHKNVVLSLRSVFDPEIPVNIYDLGLIYKIETLSNGLVKIVMTLTSPSCPEAEALPKKVEFELQQLSDSVTVEIELSWDPFWTPDRMSESCKLDLGFY